MKDEVMNEARGLYGGGDEYHLETVVEAVVSGGLEVAWCKDRVQSSMVARSVGA